MGRLRAWYDDEFGSKPFPPNALADRVLRGIGYMQPFGFWRGCVALSMEEGPGGDTAHMTTEVLAAIEDLAKETTR